MAQANTADFLGSGGNFTDPFAGLVSPISADDQTAIQANQERQRHDLLQKAADQTANINRPYQQQRASSDQEAANNASPEWWEAQFAAGTKDPNDPQNAASYAAAKALQKSNHDSMNGLGYKLATFGALAAPAAITGGAAAFGGPSALGFGSGAAVGGEAGAGGATATQVANEATGAAMAGPGFSPEAAAAANAVPAITTGGATEVPTLAAPGLATAGAAPAAGSAAAAGLSPLAKGLINGGVQAGLPLLIQGLTGGRTAEEKALLRKQEELAADAQRRQGEVQDARMNTLAQQVLAFNPRNQMLAQMFGPSAAFTPQQMAGAVQGPPPPSLPPNPTPEQKAAYDARMQQYQASEAARQKMVMSGFQQPGAGPTPLNMPAPQAARKY